ncbi:MAG: cytochrome c [Gammaproteobacteria bacterium]|nr:cytochrome c [Gammaproteobacteria bacterium]
MKRLQLFGMLAGAFSALAVVSAPTQAAGDADAGRQKTLRCLGCHGIEGYANQYPNYRVPKIAGQHADYIVAALKAYRSGQRSHKTMYAQAVDLSDQDIADIAAHLARMGNKQ